MILVALLLIAAGQVPPQDVPPVVHEQRLDEVGRAGFSNRAERSMTAWHRTLATGSYAEITALDTGRTIVVRVEKDPSLPPDNVAMLSDVAAKAIGVGDRMDAQVRIRPAAPSPVEQAAIGDGGEVTRLAAPPALLAALRRRLPSTPAPAIRPAAAPRPFAPKPVPRPIAPVTTPAKPVATPKPVTTGRWFVQVAALSDANRAATLVKTVDGVVRSTGRLYRVQAGPFTTRAAAEAARAAIARRGFADARIIAQD